MFTKLFVFWSWSWRFWDFKVVWFAFVWSEGKCFSRVIILLFYFSCMRAVKDEGEVSSLRGWNICWNWSVRFGFVSWGDVVWATPLKIDFCVDNVWTLISPRVYNRKQELKKILLWFYILFLCHSLVWSKVDSLFFRAREVYGLKLLTY